MTVGIFTLIGIIFGYFLARQDRLENAVQKVSTGIKDEINRVRFRPSVIEPDEMIVEKEEKAEKKDLIKLEDILDA